MTYILSLLRSLVRHLIHRRYLTTDMPPKYLGEKSHIYMTIVAPSEGCIVYVATVNFPTNLIKLAAATCEIIAVLRIKWRGLVNYIDVNLGGRDLLLSEIDHKGTLPTRVFTPPFAVPYSMAQNSQTKCRVVHWCRAILHHSDVAIFRYTRCLWHPTACQSVVAISPWVILKTRGPDLSREP